MNWEFNSLTIKMRQQCRKNYKISGKILIIYKVYTQIIFVGRIRP